MKKRIVILALCLTLLLSSVANAGSCNNKVRVSKSILSGTIYISLSRSADTYVTNEQVLYYIGYGSFFHVTNKPESIVLVENGQRCTYSTS